SLVAFFALGCAASGGTVIVRDARGIVLRREPAGCCDVALAGDYLATRTGGGVEVVDLRSRARVYGVDASVAGFDVQADGTLAVALDRTADGTAALVWRTAREPEL